MHEGRATSVTEEALTGTAVSESSDHSIYPTHTCFDDAVFLMGELLKKSAKFLFTDDYEIVHGICHKPDGSPYSHAWIERKAHEIFEIGIIHRERVIVEYIRTEFYELHKITDTTRYTFLQALQAEEQTGLLAGPWESRYRALCRDVQT